MPLVGVISDTHGLLRPQAVEALRCCKWLIHAGDIGSPQVLEELTRIAPVTAVRGNNDTDAWARNLPEEAFVQLDAVRICVLHDVQMLRPNRSHEGVHAVVSGHSHRPALETRDGVLYFNPGSAGPRRFKLPIAVGYLEIAGGSITGRIVELSL
jgi:uncharacterized protein